MNPPQAERMRIRRQALDAIAAHARREHPRECCGLLIGDRDEAIEAVPAANVALEPQRRYEVSPVDHLAQIKRCRDQSAQGARVDVIGVYHSHPASEARPSPTDVELACREYLFVIAGPVSDIGDIPVRGYRLAGDRLAEVQLIVAD